MTDDSKIIALGGEDNHSPTATLASFMNKDLDFVVIVGTDKEGNVHFGQSNRSSILRVLGALSAAEHHVLTTR